MLPLSFSWQIPMYKASGLPGSQATDGNSRGSGGRSAALRSRDKPSLHKPRGDRDDSTQCPLSVAPGPRPR